MWNTRPLFNCANIYDRFTMCVEFTQLVENKFPRGGGRRELTVRVSADMTVWSVLEESQSDDGSNPRHYPIFSFLKVCGWMFLTFAVVWTLWSWLHWYMYSSQQSKVYSVNCDFSSIQLDVKLHEKACLFLSVQVGVSYYHRMQFSIIERFKHNL